MSFNLITNAWIPVRTLDGQRRLIRPGQISEASVCHPDWERADFNLACYELLIGLVYLADPPKSTGDRQKRRRPNPDHLHDRFAFLAPAFNLDGNGPRFLQDLEDLDAESNDVDMLFIDSAGGSAARKNTDVLVKRGRYGKLSLSEAAMALYTLQSQAPAGGAGNRTSMRGGGPLITLVDPGLQSDTPLWDMVWANVPEGQPVTASGMEAALPWMRPTLISNKGQEVQPPDTAFTPAEVFFGMPRRLRLDFSEDELVFVTGVRQRNHGTNYGLWRHPLSPYYQQKAGSELLPLHPRAGLSSYRSWEGIAFERSTGLRHMATCVKDWQLRSDQEGTLLVGGWAMDNMKPRDFAWSRQPLYVLQNEAEDMAIAMIESANSFSLALSGAIQTASKAGELGASVVDSVREDFYQETQSTFESLLKGLANGVGSHEVATKWCQATRKSALRLFERIAMPGLSQRRTKDIKSIVDAHGQLRAAFSGYGKTGKAAFIALGLELPKIRKKKEEPA